MKTTTNTQTHTLTTGRKGGWVYSVTITGDTARIDYRTHGNSPWRQATREELFATSRYNNATAQFESRVECPNAKKLVGTDPHGTSFTVSDARSAMAFVARENRAAGHSTVWA